MARLHRDDEAVSPVIATVLLLAITVMLSGMVRVDARCLTNNGKGTATDDR